MPFTGLATYSTNVFQSLAEDVSPEVGMISPSETPTLALIGDSPINATNILYEWLEDALAPTAVVTGSAIASTAADVAIGIASGKAAEMQVGQVLTYDYTEYFQVSVIAGNTITVTRGFGGTSGTTSLASGVTLQIVSDVALEGADADRDLSVGRSRLSNYLQVYKRDVIISGTRSAVENLGGISDEMALQKAKRVKELLIQLNRSVIVGVLSGNTIGSATAYRSMRGIKKSLTTNISSVVTFTGPLLDSMIKLAWNYGGTDVNVLLCSTSHKEQIDGLNTSRVRVVNEEDKYRNAVHEYEGTYGVQRVMLERWMPPGETLALATNRIKIVSLRGRTFQFMPVGKTGDSEKGFVVGEYTLELKNQEGMARASATGT